MSESRNLIGRISPAVSHFGVRRSKSYFKYILIKFWYVPTLFEFQVPPLMKRCYELWATLTRRLRKQGYPWELMSDSPLAKRSRSSLTGQPSASAQSGLAQAITSPLALRANPSAVCCSTPDAGVPPTPTLIPIRGRASADTPATATAAATIATAAATPEAESTQGEAQSSEGAELVQRRIPPALAEGLVLPQATSAGECLWTCDVFKA